MSERRGVGLSSVPWIVGRMTGLGMLWGLLESTYLFMTRYASVLTERPASAISLVIAGLLAYGVAGAASGLALSAAWLLAGVVPPLRRLFQDRGVFVAVGALLAGPVSFALFIVKFHPAFFRRTPFMHPTVLASLAGVLLVGAVLGVLLYLALRGRASTFAPMLRRGLLGLCALAGVFFLIGAVRGLIGAAPPETIVPLEVERRAVPAGSEELPNIVVVTFETLRADRAGVGDADSNMPFLTELAKEGVLFRTYFTQAPWTRPSMASFFTSLYPQQHGMNTVASQLDTNVPTFPDVLRDAGYHTVYFNTNGSAFDPSYGFDEHYQDYPKLEPHYLSPLSVRPFFIARFYMSFLLDPFQLLIPRDDVNWDWYEDGERVNEFIDTWLDTRPAGPLFLHVHYIDPHHPYYDHPYRGFQLNTRAEWNVEQLREYYDIEIRYSDRVFSELVAMLDEAGLWEDSLLVVSSDHGEEFLDHGDWFHVASLHPELTHVPFVLRWPGRLPEGVVVEGQVQSVDVAPTVLDLVGVAAPESFEGRSVVPIATGEELDEREVMNQNLDPGIHVNGLRADGFKYVRYEESGTLREELYDIRTDPTEHRDVLAQHPDVARSMASRVDEYLAYFAGSSQAAGERELTDDERERLRALGYMD